MTTTNKLCTKFKVVQGSKTHGVDNTAALKNCFGPDKPDTTMPCFHLIKFLRAAIKQSPIKWIRQKVKGHQDREKSYDQLDCWGKANVQADRLATEHMAWSDTKSHQPVHKCKTKDGQY